MRLIQLSRVNSKLLFSNFFVWVPVGMAISGYAALFRHYPGKSMDFAILGIEVAFAVAAILAGNHYKRHLLRKVLISQRSPLLAEQTVELGETGLHATGEYGEAHYPWSAFSYVGEDDKNLYLFLDNSMAFVLPKAALGSPDNIAQVRAWVH